MKVRGVVIIVFLFVVVWCSVGFAFTPVDIKILHKQAWQRVVDMAVSDRWQAKMALYASRTLMVKHPELYLLSDRMYIHIFRKAKGIIRFKEISAKDPLFFSHRREERVLWMSIIRSLRGSSRGVLSGAKTFSWGYVKNFSVYNPAPLRAFYPGESCWFNVLDLRLPFFWNTLWNYDKKIPIISLGEGRFLKALDEGHKDAYLLVTDKGYAYPYYAGSLRDWRTGGEISAIPSDGGKVMLVMNTRYVWYPLFGRDDRDKDEVLKKVVRDYCREGYIPELTTFERTIVSKLRKVTEALGIKGKEWIRVAAGHIFGQRVLCSSPETYDIYSHFLPADLWWSRRPVHTSSESVLYIVSMESYILSNALSPAGAVLAAVLKENISNPAGALSSLSKRYLSWFRLMRGFPGRRWFDNWEPTMDDKMISSASNCRIEAANVASAFWIVQPPWNVFMPNWDANGRGGHVIIGIYTKGYAALLSNAKFVSGKGPLYAFHHHHGPRVVFANVIDVKSLDFVVFQENLRWSWRRLHYKDTMWSSMPLFKTVNFTKRLWKLEPGFRVADKWEGKMWSSFDNFNSWVSNVGKKRFVKVKISIF